MGRTAPKQQADPLGRKLCRNCGKLVPRGRHSYCSSDCATDFSVKYFPSHTRRHVFKRDRGICAICGCDTEKLRRILAFVNGDGRVRWHLHRIANAVAADLGFGFRGGRGRFWQADHIIPVARGGWGLGLDNFRTLCTPCHKAETARLAAELAKERKAA